MPVEVVEVVEACAREVFHYDDAAFCPEDGGDDEREGGGEGVEVCADAVDVVGFDFEVEFVGKSVGGRMGGGGGVGGRFTRIPFRPRAIPWGILGRNT